MCCRPSSSTRRRSASWPWRRSSTSRGWASAVFRSWRCCAPARPTTCASASSPCRGWSRTRQGPSSASSPSACRGRPPRWSLLWPAAAFSRAWTPGASIRTWTTSFSSPSPRGGRAPNWTCSSTRSAPTSSPGAPVKEARYACRPATIFELSRPGRRAYRLRPPTPPSSLDELIPVSPCTAAPAGLPEVAEIDLLRHFTALSRLNYGVESGPYPLGSCTMKYNPKINEHIANLPGLAGPAPVRARRDGTGRSRAAARPRRVAGRDRRPAARQRCSRPPARTAS